MGLFRRNKGKFLMLIKIVLEIIKRNLTHSSKAISGLAFTIAIVVSLLSLINGLNLEFSSLIYQSGSSESIIIKNAVNDSFSKDIIDDYSFYNVKSILPKYESFVDYYQQGINNRLELIKLNLTNYIKSHPDSYLLNGFLPEQINETVIGQNLAKSLRFSVNDVISTSNGNLSIVGILEDDYGLLNSLIIDTTNFQMVTSIEIVLNSSNKNEIVLNQLKDNLGAEFSISFKKKNNEFLNSVFNEILSKFTYIVGIICIISLIRIYFFTYWILINHINDFLLLRILGTSKKDVFLLCLSFSLIIGNSAIFLGIFMGLSLPIFMSSIIKIILGFSYVAFLPDQNFILGTIIVLNFSFILGAIKPSWQMIQSPLIIQQTN
jgi:ABC-type lipoprotein release transport system permease subunit